jgi:hypothetical protein
VGLHHIATKGFSYFIVRVGISLRVGINGYNDA